MKTLLLLVFSSVILNLVYCDVENCLTNEGKKGVCTTIEKCEQALQDLRRNVAPTICGFHGKESYVCCGLTSSYKIGDISREKCNEYNGLGTIFVPGIIDGVRSASEEFPHMVALGFGSEDDIKWNCGGSIISENFVLTAAHCLYSGDHGEVKYIRAGTITLQNPEGTFQDFKVAQTIPHPNFKSPARYHDTALIKLDKSIMFTKSVKPACLQTSFQFNGSLSATGWGHLYSGGDPSNDLMKVDLVQYSNSRCYMVYSKDKRIVPNGIRESLMVCATGRKNEEKDTCQGDSGGPLQIKTRYHTTVGITSFGKLCGISDFPAVYTRVSNYIEWIENIVWAYCRFPYSYVNLLLFFTTATNSS